MKNHIVIIGRPNVGKSAIFNRLIGKKKSLVLNQSGVTRDRINHNAQWWIHAKPYDVTVTDTGGLVFDETFFHQSIVTQVVFALENASIVCIIFDAQTGLTASDQDVVLYAQKMGLFQKKCVIGLVNKIDMPQHEILMADFYALGWNNLFAVSAEHDRGFANLKDKLVDLNVLESTTDERLNAFVPRIAIVGRPNVGKSSLFNALAGSTRAIVYEIAGTTIDTLDETIYWDQAPFIITDTAGVRRRSKTEQGLEVLSVVQTKKALENSDIAFLVLDIETGILNQDEKVASLILEARLGVIIIVNKWDTQTDQSCAESEKMIRQRFNYLAYAPILFVSAKCQTGLKKIKAAVQDILIARQLKLPTHEFTEWVRKESKCYNPKNAKFFLCHQTAKNPPRFVLHVNDPDKIDFSLKRHLVNAMRERWGFKGIPLDLQIKKANRRSLPKNNPSPSK
jgi:GTP-binding protein